MPCNGVHGLGDQKKLLNYWVYVVSDNALKLIDIIILDL